MKYYGYYRVSTDTQLEKGYGLDSQKNAILKYAKENDITITELFHDDGISGTSTEREGLIALLSVLDEGDKVIVLNTSRLWRDENAKYLIRYKLEKAKADIISLEQLSYTIYTKDPMIRLFNGITELLDEYTRLEINIKLARGRKTKADKGSKACGTAPYGYKWDNAEILIDYNNHLVVQDIFDKYIELGSYGKLQAYTIEKGYKTRNGKDFSKQSLSNIIHNDFYIGVVTHGNVKTRGTHEPIILYNTFLKANPEYKEI